MFNMILGLQRLNVACQVVLPEQGPFCDKLDEAGVPYHLLPFYPNTYRPLHPSRFRVKRHYQHNQTIALPQLLALRDQYAYTWIYSNSSVFDLGALLAEAVQLPHFWHVRSMAAQFYGYHYHPSKAQMGEQLKQAAVVLCISQTVETYLKEYFRADLPTTVLFDAIHGLGLADYSPHPLRAIIDAPRLLTVGSLHPNKQHHWAIHAVAQLRHRFPEVHLCIAGSGRLLYRLKLQALIRLLGVQQHVTLLGHVSDIEALYDESDIVIMPSKGEGLGRVTLEGMLAQRPVVGFNDGGTQELIEHDRTGLLYDNVSDLVEQVERLCTSPKLYQRITSDALRWVLEHFGEDKYAKAIQQILLNHRI